MKKHIEYLEPEEKNFNIGEDGPLLFIVKRMLKYFEIDLNDRKLIKQLLDSGFKITDLTWSKTAEKNFWKTYGKVFNKLNPYEKIVLLIYLSPKTLEDIYDEI